MKDVKFYMLIEGEDNLYLALYDTEKNLISSYSNLNQSKINNYIENLENEKEFFSSINFITFFTISGLWWRKKRRS